MPLERNCMQCGVVVAIPPNRAESFKFCSIACKTQSEAIPKEPMQCITCSKRFSVVARRRSTARYCSKACYYKGMKGRGSIEMQCACCGVIMRTSPSRSRQKKFCSRACQGRAKARSVDNPAMPSTARKRAKRLGLLTSCQRCDYSERPEILVTHHTDRNRLNNSATNIEILCPNCHAIEHYGETRKAVHRAVS
jgi:hypothetical protein